MLNPLRLRAMFWKIGRRLSSATPTISKGAMVGAAAGGAIGAVRGAVSSTPDAEYAMEHPFRSAIHQTAETAKSAIAGAATGAGVGAITGGVGHAVQVVGRAKAIKAVRSARIGSEAREMASRLNRTGIYGPLRPPLAKPTPIRPPLKTGGGGPLRPPVPETPQPPKRALAPPISSPAATRPGSSFAGPVRPPTLVSISPGAHLAHDVTAPPHIPSGFEKRRNAYFRMATKEKVRLKKAAGLYAEHAGSRLESGMPRPYYTPGIRYSSV